MPKRRAIITLADGTVSVEAPGLKQIRRADGAKEFYWVAARMASQRGYLPKTLKLRPPETVDEAHDLASRCRDAQNQMIEWLETGDANAIPLEYDGTIASLVRLYLDHPDSPYADLVRSSRQTYKDQFEVVVSTVGARRLDHLQPIDVKRWYRNWGNPASPGGERRTRRAYGGVQMVRVAFAFGVSLGIRDCKRLADGISAIRFAQPKPRTATIDAEMAQRFVDVALAANEARMALGTAVQFELTLRQADVIGQMVDDPAEPARGAARSSIWQGLTFEHIDTRGVLSATSSKSGRTTTYDLAAYPLIQQSLASIPPSERTGPMVAKSNGAPMDRWEYARLWRTLAVAAGIPESVWNRDVRASGVTEAREAGAALEDVAHVAGHSGVQTTSRVYDRSGLAVTARVQKSRVKARKQKKD